MCVLSLSNFFLPLVTLNYGEAEALVSRPGHGMKKKKKKEVRASFFLSSWFFLYGIYNLFKL